MKEIARTYEEIPAPIEKLRRYEEVGELFRRFNKLNLSFEEDYQGKLTHSQWRAIKRDLKKIEKVKIYHVDERWDIISTELAELKDAFKYLD